LRRNQRGGLEEISISFRCHSIFSLAFSLSVVFWWLVSRVALYIKDLRVRSRFRFALDGALTQIPREELIRVRLNLLIRTSIFAAQGALHDIRVYLFSENKDYQHHFGALVVFGFSYVHLFHLLSFVQKIIPQPPWR
jgi:hypothetical protein